MDATAWSAWFLGACALAALICTIAGAVALARAAAAVKRRMRTLAPRGLIAKAQVAQEASKRIERDLVLAEALAPRLMAAIGRIDHSLRILRFVFSLVR